MIKVDNRKSLAQLERVQNLILFIRGKRVIIDADLAMLYGVTTKALNQAIKRNRERFPEDFMFPLFKHEKDEVVTNCDHLANLRYSKFLPYAFTEHGAIMAASVLNTERAIEVSVYVVRAFVKLRQILSTHKELAQKLDELERRLNSHDETLRSLIITIRKLMEPPTGDTRKAIGFKRTSKKSSNNKNQKMKQEEARERG